MKEEKDPKQLTGFVDTQAVGEFFHYLSVGSMPTTAAKEQQVKTGFYKTDEGGGIAFKHQTIVEFVPFFLQAEDDPQAWCHIPHFMRISPGWDGGNIVFPYPMHLAKCMIVDQLCILNGGLNDERGLKTSSLPLNGTVPYMVKWLCWLLSRIHSKIRNYRGMQEILKPLFWFVDYKEKALIEPA